MQMLSAKDVAQKLVEINAIKVNPNQPFKWASGRYAPIYCDNRTILSFPALRTAIKESLVVKAQEFGRFNKIAGVATAGIAHGALLADAMNLPFIYVRSNPKAHGTKSQIEGIYSAEDECLVVEDLISTGGSSIAAVEVLRAHHIKVSGVISIFNYAFDSAVENFEKAQCPFTSLSNYHALIEAIEDSGAWKKNELRSLIKWRENPVLWSDQFEKKINNKR